MEHLHFHPWLSQLTETSITVDYTLHPHHHHPSHHTLQPPPLPPPPTILFNKDFLCPTPAAVTEQLAGTSGKTPPSFLGVVSGSGGGTCGADMLGSTTQPPPPPPLAMTGPPHFVDLHVNPGESFSLCHESQQKSKAVIHSVRDLLLVVINFPL